MTNELKTIESKLRDLLEMSSAQIYEGIRGVLTYTCNIILDFDIESKGNVWDNAPEGMALNSTQRRICFTE